MDPEFFWSSWSFVSENAGLTLPKKKNSSRVKMMIIHDNLVGALEYGFYILL